MAEEAQKKAEETIESEKILAKIEIIMMLDKDERPFIAIKGPLGNKPLFKALLAGAEEAINGYKPQVIPVKGFSGLMPGRG